MRTPGWPADIFLFLYLLGAHLLNLIASGTPVHFYLLWLILPNLNLGILYALDYSGAHPEFFHGGGGGGADPDAIYNLFDFNY
jgi:hypothetical protein